MPAPILPGVIAEGGTPSRSWSFTSENTSLTETRKFVGVPGNLIGMVHPDYAYLWLDSVQATEISSGVYSAQLTWNSRSIHRNTSGVFKPIIKYGTWMLRQTVTRDLENGNPVKNTAGQDFDSVPERDIPQPLRSITIRKSAYPSAHEDFIGSANSATFTIAGVAYPKYCATLDGIEASEEKTDPTDSSSYWICTYTFRLSTHTEDGVRIGFRASFLSHGYTNASGQHKVGADNIQLEKPSMLDAAGAFTSTPYWQNFSILPLKNFATLDLPTGS